MPATVTHEAFPQPANAKQTIWRYLDFAKFVAMLATRSLHFARLDQLGDPFEGSLSKAEFDLWTRVATEGETAGNIPEDWKGKYLDILLANARRTRRAVYVNCWHQSDGESEAMWKVYAPSGYGVAVRSTYEKLVNVLPSTLHSGCFVGVVKYTDHHTEAMPQGNAFYAPLHKRRAFEHERELRALVWIADTGFWNDPDQSQNPLGIDVSVDLAELIEAVRVSPSAPEWFLKAVEAVSGRFDMRLSVGQSELVRPPYY